MTEPTLHETFARGEPAWPVVQSWIRAAKNHVEVLPPDEDRKDEILQDTGVTLQSPMGAIVYHTGGLLVDHGWLRFLGSGGPRLPRSIPAWNRGRSRDASGSPRGFFLFADDVIGGFFALNGGAFEGHKAGVFYFAPDTLRWEPLAGMGYTEFLNWSLHSDLEKFYASLRWPGWQAEISTLPGDKALSIYPPLWTKEGKKISECSRRPCSISEIYGLNVEEIPKQLSS